MAVNSVLSPYPTFVDAQGLPLENGYIYIGTAGFEARTTPKASFFDVALTIPTGTASGAAIRTRAGLPIGTSNAPAMFYVDGDYSISVLDRNGVLLYSALNMTLALNVGGSIGPVLAPDGNLGATGFGFTNETNTGFVRSGTGTVQDVVQGVVVSQRTATGTTFAQPTVLSGAVSGAGFTAAVGAIAQPLDADLTALAGLASAGMIARTGAGTVAARTLTAGTGISISNGDGVSGNPTITNTLTVEATVLLGTLATTSGSSVTLSSLVLTDYKFLKVVFRAIQTNDAASNLLIAGDDCAAALGASNRYHGTADIDLSDGTWSCTMGIAGSSTGSGAGSAYGGNSGYTTATTSVVFALDVGSFTAGSILVYGVK